MMSWFSDLSWASSTMTTATFSSAGSEPSSLFTSFPSVQKLKLCVLFALRFRLFYLQYFGPVFVEVLIELYGVSDLHGIGGPWGLSLGGLPSVVVDLTQVRRQQVARLDARQAARACDDADLLVRQELETACWATLQLGPIVLTLSTYCVMISGYVKVFPVPAAPTTITTCSPFGFSESCTSSAACLLAVSPPAGRFSRVRRRSSCMAPCCMIPRCGRKKNS